MPNIWPSRESTKKRIATALRSFSAKRPLPGIADPQALDTLSQQFVASLRREEYTARLLAREASAERANPHSESFDADRAVVYHMRHGNADEAAWLIFLMTHFGKPEGSGWRRLTDVYGRLGKGRWTWDSVSSNTDAFEHWLSEHWDRIGGKFGNHRKYETLRPDSPKGTAAVVRSYVAWVGPSHELHFSKAVRATGNDPHTIFHALYRGMRVSRFGRLAKFDYLALIGRYGIAPIAPGSAYLDEATGPARGARLLFDGKVDGPSKPDALQAAFDELAPALGVGMQVMEDALCNWQKSPRAFIHFKG